MTSLDIKIWCLEIAIKNTIAIFQLIRLLKTTYRVTEAVHLILWKKLSNKINLQNKVFCDLIHIVLAADHWCVTGKVLKAHLWGFWRMRMVYFQSSHVLNLIWMEWAGFRHLSRVNGNEAWCIHYRRCCTVPFDHCPCLFAIFCQEQWFLEKWAWPKSIDCMVLVTKDKTSFMGK